MSGLFISFEGGEGVGKTTQADLLAKRLQDEGRRVVRVHEPGGTLLGEEIRGWVKSEKPLTLRAELLLFAAARAELVNRVIRPELDRGTVVIADRYADSTTVYQGDGRRLPHSTVSEANAIATDGLWPRLTMLLDMPAEASLQRVNLQASFDEQGHVGKLTPRADDEGARRFESLEPGFHQRVRNGYRRLAEAEPKRWATLDASQPIEIIHADVYKQVRAVLPPIEAAAPHHSPLSLSLSRTLSRRLRFPRGSGGANALPAARRRSRPPRELR